MVTYLHVALLAHLSKVITVKAHVHVDLLSFHRATASRVDKITKELEEEVS